MGYTFVIRILNKTVSPTFKKGELNSLSFDHLSPQVWQLSWSVLGTVLSSAGDDGLIKLWKNGKNGKWESVSEMRVKWDGTPSGMIGV